MALFSLLCSLLRWIGETSLIHSIILQYIRCATPFNFIYNSIFFLQFWGVVQKEKIVVVEVRTAHRAAERIVADNKETGWTRTAETVNRHLFLFILYILTLFVCVSLWHWLLDVEQQQPEEKNRVLPLRFFFFVCMYRRRGACSSTSSCVGCRYIGNRILNTTE